MDDDERVELAVVDRSIFAKQGYGETVADILKRNGVGNPAGKIPMLEESVGGTRARVARAQLMKQKLYWDKNTRPKILYFENCHNAIRTIPQLIHSEINPEDLDTNGEDHAYDAITYLIQKLEDVKTKKPLTSIEQKFAAMKQAQQLEPAMVLNKRFTDEV